MKIIYIMKRDAGLLARCNYKEQAICMPNFNKFSLCSWAYVSIHDVIHQTFHDFCMKIPEGMDGPMKHETFARCRTSRSVKQS